MIHRQPQLPLASRILAAGCVAIWLTGSSICNLGALCCCDSHDSETIAHADSGLSADTTGVGTDHAPDADAHHSDVADGCSHDSPEHDSKKCACCSKLIAVVPSAETVVFCKPDFHPISLICVLVKTHAASLARSENPPNRHAHRWDRAFTPKVCLDPAHRSHAPPAFRLI